MYFRMAELDHWQPVLASHQLKNKPVAVKLAGYELVVFRAQRGKIGVLNDCCVHRRMRLSQGSVDAGRLRCKYHGWTYNCDGEGESPATPKMYARTEAFDVLEEYGLIW